MAHEGRLTMRHALSSAARKARRRIAVPTAVLASLLLAMTPVPAQESGPGEVFLPDLLPPPDGGTAVAPEGGDLLPPAEGGLAGSDSAVPPEEEIVVVDPNMPQAPPPPLPEGMVRVVFQNVTAAPVDLFIDAMDGSDPTWVMTLAGGFEVVQPSLIGQTWRLAQNDEWMGGFVPSAEPRQIIRFSGPKP